MSDVLERLRMKETKGTATLEELAAADEIVMLGRALEHAYRNINFGFEYGSFDFSVLRKDARVYFEKYPEGQF